jgi:hypothetical protein
MQHVKLIYILWLSAIFIAACTASEPLVNSTDNNEEQPITESESVPLSITPALDNEIIVAPSATAVTPPPTAPPTNTPPEPGNTVTAITVEATIEPTAASTPPTATTALIITHHDVDRFHDIPDEDIAAAGQLTWLFRHASVGVNIQDGLDCLMNNFERRPHRCDRGLPADQIFHDPKYDHRNWQFEFHSPPPGQNPGWWNKVGFFIERMNTLAPHEQYDFVSFKMGYVDAHQESNISLFFVADADANLPDYRDIEALQAQLGDTEIIWWTLGLARLSYVESQEFNDQLRDYVAANNGILIDIADIMSHTATGEQCFDNAGNGIIALCPEYTDEVNAGHLNATGRLRMAKAIWVLMARLAGWEG